MIIVNAWRIMKNSQFWGSSWFFWKNRSEGLNKNTKLWDIISMLWFELFSPPCTDTKVLEKKIVALDMNKKQTENEVKWHEDKWIKTNQNEDRLDGDWMKVDPTKSLKLCLWGFKILILKAKCVKYLHHLKS